MPDFRKGADAVKQTVAKAKEGGGEFTPFTPQMFWTQDSEGKEKYVLFLNPMGEIVTVDMIGFIPVKRGKYDGYEQVIARTDAAIGESKDPMVEEWGAAPRETCVAVAVELEPVIEEVNGRKRPVGFEVAYRTFERKVKDAKGELTDETEEVDVPQIGFVTQSPHNFFNLVQGYDENEGPIEDTPFKVERLDKNTYRLQDYPDAPVDLSNLIECMDGLSYLTENERKELLDQIEVILDGEGEEEDKDREAAALIGAVLLDKRLGELVDRERYDKLFEGIDKPFKFGNKKAKEDDKKSSRRGSSRRERPARRTQRRDSDTEAEAAVEETTGQEPEAEKPKDEKPARRTRTRTRAKADDAPEADSDDAKPSGNAKLNELRERRGRRTAA